MVELRARAREMTLQEEYRLLFAVFGSFWLLVACVVALVPFRSAHALAAIALILLLPPLAATGAGPLVAAGAAAFSALAFDVFFTQPYYSPRIASGDSVAAFVAYLAVAVTVSVIVARLREARALANRRLAEAELLQALTEELVEDGDVSASVRRSLVHLAHALRLHGSSMQARVGDARMVVSTGNATAADGLARKLLAVQRADGSVPSGPGEPAAFAVTAGGRSLGYLVADPGGEPLGPDRERMLFAYASVLALTLDGRA